ncbi:MAG TPA: SDR family NAD(P)-dependent oxidoreductase [Chitinophagaceae bacterium]|nr:SDR family NAD(P)-dependent oxidoreductase [Chitinophagaceae bacterium]
MNLSGNTILITGGTSGIGLGFAEQLILSGNTVIICGRRADRLQEISHQYPAIITRKSDLQSATERITLCDWVLSRHPALNMLINNAGIQLMGDLTRPLDSGRISSEVETNLVAPIHLVSLLAPTLSAKESAAIINISSGLAFVPISFMPVYCATKAAIHSLTLSLRYQLRNTPVKVFEVIPPSVDTELGHDRRPDKSSSHGGMPVNEFIREAMQAIKLDLLEAPIGDAKNLRDQGEQWFGRLNR